MTKVSLKSNFKWIQQICHWSTIMQYSRLKGNITYLFNILKLRSVPYQQCFGIRIQFNPDPAKNLNPDPDDPESGSKLFLNNI